MGAPFKERAAWIDNRFIEQLWRSVKYEDGYLNDYGDGLSADRGLRRWFEKYNQLRPHQALENATPVEWYRSPLSYGGQPPRWEAMQPVGTTKLKPSHKAGPEIESSAPDDF